LKRLDSIFDSPQGFNGFLTRICKEISETVTTEIHFFKEAIELIKDLNNPPENILDLRFQIKALNDSALTTDYGNFNKKSRKNEFIALNIKGCVKILPKNLELDVEKIGNSLVSDFSENMGLKNEYVTNANRK